MSMETWLGLKREVQRRSARHRDDQNEHRICKVWRHLLELPEALAKADGSFKRAFEAGQMRRIDKCKTAWWFHSRLANSDIQLCQTLARTVLMPRTYQTLLLKFVEVGQISLRHNEQQLQLVLKICPITRLLVWQVTLPSNLTSQTELVKDRFYVIHTESLLEEQSLKGIAQAAKSAGVINPVHLAVFRRLYPLFAHFVRHCELDFEHISYTSLESQICKSLLKRGGWNATFNVYSQRARMVEELAEGRVQAMFEKGKISLKVNQSYDLDIGLYQLSVEERFACQIVERPFLILIVAEHMALNRGKADTSPASSRTSSRNSHKRAKEQNRKKGKESKWKGPKRDKQRPSAVRRHRPQPKEQSVTSTTKEPQGERVTPQQKQALQLTKERMLFDFQLSSYSKFKSAFMQMMEKKDNFSSCKRSRLNIKEEKLQVDY